MQQPDLAKLLHAQSQNPAITQVLRAKLGNRPRRLAETREPQSPTSTGNPLSVAEPYCGPLMKTLVPKSSIRVLTSGFQCTGLDSKGMHSNSKSRLVFYERNDSLLNHTIFCSNTILLLLKQTFLRLDFRCNAGTRKLPEMTAVNACQNHNAGLCVRSRFPR